MFKRMLLQSTRHTKPQSLAYREEEKEEIWCCCCCFSCCSNPSVSVEDDVLSFFPLEHFRVN